MDAISTEADHTTDSPAASPVVFISHSWVKTIYLIIAIFAVCANSVVLIVIGLAKSLRKTYTNGYIFNQSIIDLIASIILIFFVLTPPNVSVYYTLGDDLVCRLWLTRHPLWAMLVSSTYNLVVLTFERYLAVLHPIWYKLKFGRKTFVASLVFIWVSGPLINSYHWITAHIEDGVCFRYQYPNKTTKTAVGIISAVLQFLFPLAFHIFCYGRMICVFREKRIVNTVTNNIQGLSVQQQQPKAKHTDMNTKISRNMLMMLVMVTVGFVLCWAWNSMLWLVVNFGVKVDVTAPFYHFTVVMIYLNCCVNPVVYFIKYDQFKKSLVQIVCRRGGAEDSNSITTSSIA